MNLSKAQTTILSAFFFQNEFNLNVSSKAIPGHAGDSVCYTSAYCRKLMRVPRILQKIFGPPTHAEDPCLTSSGTCESAKLAVPVRVANMMIGIDMWWYLLLYFR